MRHRSQPARLAIVAATGLFAAAACGSPGTGPPAAASGYQVKLNHSVTATPSAADHVDWLTSWTLTWGPVPDADGYAVYIATSEGQPDGPANRTVENPELTIEAAAGTSPVDRLEQDRGAALSGTAAQLIVAIAPVGHDGSQGPRSPWFAVGDELPNGSG